MDKGNRLLKLMSSIAYSISGLKIKVAYGNNAELACSYVDSGKYVIEINPHCCESINMDDSENEYFTFALFLHELMHCIRTDFASWNQMSREASSVHDKSLMSFLNTIEDPAIEHLAVMYVSGWILDSIEFMNDKLYQHTDELERQTVTSNQFMHALVQYSYKAELKNKFTDKTAEAAFKMCVPEINKIINIPDGTQRLEMGKDLYYRVKEKYPEVFENFDDEHNNAAEMKSGQDNLSGSDCLGEGNQVHSQDVPNIPDSKEGKRIKMEEAATGGKLDSIKSESGSEGEKESDKARNINNIKELENLLKNTADKEDSSVNISRYKDLQSINYYSKSIPLSARNISYYKQIAGANRKLINSMISSFAPIFLDEIEEKTNGNSGRFNIKSYSQRGNSSTRWFDKRSRLSENKDSSVIILVDISGSMVADSRIKDAKKCCIILTEVFEHLNVKLSVIGYTADYDNEDKKCIDQPVHYHYMDWNYKDKYNLSEIYPQANNFDGYSIRYATELLRKQESSNKLLIVISDGYPECHYYYHHDGFADTAGAVRETKNVCDIIGILIGDDCTPEKAHDMYGSNFVYAKKSSQITNLLLPKLKKIMREW